MMMVIKKKKSLASLNPNNISRVIPPIYDCSFGWREPEVENAWIIRVKLAPEKF